jgi:hypothetical protein
MNRTYSNPKAVVNWFFGMRCQPLEGGTTTHVGLLSLVRRTHYGWCVERTTAGAFYAPYGWFFGMRCQPLEGGTTTHVGLLSLVRRTHPTAV